MNLTRIRFIFVVGLLVLGFPLVSYCADAETIIIYGDTRTHQDIHAQVANAILTTGPDVIFHLGDCATEPGDKEEWNTFMTIVNRLKEKARFHAVVGNHDVSANGGGAGDLFFTFFDVSILKSWYDVDVDGIHFVILDSTRPLDHSADQYHWLVNNLTQSQGRYDFIVLLLHYPLFTAGAAVQEAEKFRSVLVPLCEDFGVDIVFSGHDHNYQRTLHNGIYYIVTGGGGAPLYDQTSSSEECLQFIRDYHFCKLTNNNGVLNITTYDRDLNILDEFQVFPTAYTSEVLPEVSPR